MARRGSAAWRARVAEGTRRGQRPWRDGQRILPRHVRRLLARHQVHASLQGIVNDVLRDVGELVEELGGHDGLTARQRAHLRSLLIARVASEAYFASALRNGDLAGFTSAAPHLNGASAALQSLGAQRSDTDDGIDDSARALAAAGGNGELQGSAGSASGDRSSEGDGGGEA